MEDLYAQAKKIFSWQKNLVADHTEISASFTGTAGLAGLLAAKRDGCIDSDDSVVILLTGVDRAF
jgi:threonine synthase